MLMSVQKTFFPPGIPSLPVQLPRAKCIFPFMDHPQQEIPEDLKPIVSVSYWTCTGVAAS